MQIQWRRLIPLTLLAAFAQAHAVDVTGWSKTMVVSFPGYTNAEALSSFPVMVRLKTVDVAGFSYSQFASVDGYDLRFTDGSTNAWLNYEFDKWNTGGSSYIWVKVPTLTAGTNIIAFWGNPAATAQQAYTTNGATWSSTYAAVWHLGEANGPFKDSTINANHSFRDGGNTQSAAHTAVGFGRTFDGNGFIDVPSNSPSLLQQDTMTFEFWARCPAWAGEYYQVLGGFYSAHSYSAQTQSGKFIMQHRSYDMLRPGYIPGTSDIEDNNVHYYTYTYGISDNMGRLYVNSVLENAKNVGTEFLNAPVPHDFFVLGSALEWSQQTRSRYFKGDIDEVRVSKVVRTPAWITATQRTIASNAVFQAYAAVADVVPGEPVENPILIANGDLWKFHNTGALPDASWTARTYADGAWTGGAAPLGYNDPAIVTALTWGGVDSNRWITYYFRKAFTVTNTATVTGLLASFVADDGAILYLNGTKIHTTTNMPAPSDNSSQASPFVPEPYVPMAFTISPTLLVTGTNVLAVEVHQAGAGSSDLYFDMSLTKVDYATTNQVGGGFSTTNEPPNLTDPSASWVAYNDLSWSSGQLEARMTKLSFVDDADHDLSGRLVKYADGTQTPVTMSLSAVTGAGLWVTTNQGAPSAGTPGYVYFDGKLDMNRTVYAPAANGGTITLSGMDPTRKYKIVVLGNRGDPTYTVRTTVITLSGADSFVNASTPGAVISGTADETTLIVTGTNTGGQVFIYTDVMPGTDGQVQLAVGSDAGNTFSWYLNTMAVELLATGGSGGDADTDGMDDAWETTNFGGTGAANGGALEDYDHDGSMNYDEYRAGTDPTSAGSRLEFSNLVPVLGSQMILSWPSVAGKTYSVRYATGMKSSWTTLQGGIPATAPLNVYTATTAQAIGYLRIQVE